jgi:RimJ/RimL family protein N-acetyltransferase
MSYFAQSPVVSQGVRKPTLLPRFFRWFSERCVLRQLDTADVPRIWKAVLHPAYARCWSRRSPRSEGDVADLVQAAQADWQRGTRYAMAIERKQSHEFVGLIEAGAGSARGHWHLTWFFHPVFANDGLALESLSASVDLLFGTLDAQALYADCPRQHPLFEQVLNDAGFIELVPAGSLDHTTGRPRAQSLYELRRNDWMQIRRAREQAGTPSMWPQTGPGSELSLI